MFKVITLFLLIITSDVAKSQNIFSALHLNDEREYKTKRPKKIVETNIFHNTNGKQEDKNVKFFDEAGMLLKEERYNEEGAITARRTINNDTVNRLNISSTFERWNKWGYSKEITFHIYDSSKFLVEVRNEDVNGNVLMMTKVICNNKGLPIQVSTFDRNGKPFGKEVATYSYETNTVYTSVFSSEGIQLSSDSMKIKFEKTTLISHSTDVYNSNGDLIAWESTNFDGSKTIYEEEYEYDKWGNCTENKIYKVTIGENGKRKRKIDRVFKKAYTY